MMELLKKYSEADTTRSSCKQLPIMKDVYVLTPSEYAAYANFSSKQYWKNLRFVFPPEITSINVLDIVSPDKLSHVNLREAVFQPTPSELVFKNYVANQTYELLFSLRNMDKITHSINVLQEQSPYFEILSNLNQSSKVAAGLSVTFRVKFTPDSRRDFRHCITCVTTREVFVIPVYCIGPRPLLSLPDKILFGHCPVRYSKKKTLLLRNIGNVTAKASIECHGPFTVVPSSMVLNTEESVEVKVTFCPETCSTLKGKLLVTLKTGEVIHSDLHGEGKECAVSLTKSVLRPGCCFIGLQIQSRLCLKNDDEFPLRFKWSPFTNVNEERQSQRELLSMLSGTKDESSPEIRRKLAYWIHQFTNPDIPYPTDLHLVKYVPFSVKPIEGVVRPYSEKEIVITFSPEKAQEYQDTLYCDVEGRCERLRLDVNGLGVGPRVKYSFCCLDIGRVFIGSKHSYELVLSNVGCIDAIFTVQKPKTLFSSCFTLTPEEGLINPGGYQAIQIDFYSPSQLGQFEEYFEFLSDGCIKSDRITVRGEVVGPTFHFDVNEVDFGQISYAFSAQRSVILRNTSYIPMNYKLRVVGHLEAHVGGSNAGSEQKNGPEEPNLHITTEPENRSCEDMHQPSSDSLDSPKSVLPEICEYHVSPSDGQLKAMSSTEISISCHPRSLGLHKHWLRVDVNGVGEGLYALPLTMECCYPTVTVQPEELNMGRCFLRHAYEKTLKLNNESGQPASYKLVECSIQQNLEGSTVEIEYYSPKPEGEISPFGSTDMKIFVKSLQLGQFQTLLKIVICDREDKALIIPITCIGEGPVIYIEPTKLDWGTIPVLQSNRKTITLTNESVIPAVFTLKTDNVDSIYKTEPTCGTIPPLSHREVFVIAKPDDTITFRENLLLMVEDTKTIRHISLSSTGSGGTITTEPAMPSTLHLGPYFGSLPARNVFHITNRGRRQQQLIWSIEGHSVRRQSVSDAKPDMSDSTWIITPHRFEIGPGASADVTLEVSSPAPGTVSRKILCHTILGRKGAKTLIKTVNCAVEFIAPLVYLSSHELIYRVEKSPTDHLEKQTQELCLRNDSGLPLTCLLELVYPFSLLDNGLAVSKQNLHLEAGQSVPIHVQFDPAYQNDQYSRRADELLFVRYEQHPQTDAVRLVGEVHFPNLEFDTNRISFGYILNHTEVTRQVTMKNVSPLPVRFRWSFLVGQRTNIVFKRQARLKSPKSGSQCFETTELDHSEVDKDVVRQSVDEPRKNECQNEEHQYVDDEKLNEKDLQLVTDAEQIHLDESKRVHITQDSASEESDDLHANLEEQKTSENETLKLLLEKDNDVVPLGIEELFDITPIYGELEPEQSQPISFVFFGHANVEGNVEALCEVDGGPTYSVELSGGASEIEYDLDRTEILYEPVRYDKPAVSQINLLNTGQVSFEFIVFPEESCSEEPNEELSDAPNPSDIITGQLTVEPASGCLSAGELCQINITYLARKPCTFERVIKLQVAHFEPRRITLRGVADFPRLMMDLPRYYSSTKRKHIDRTPGENSDPSKPTPVDSPVFEHVMSQLISNLHLYVTQQLQKSKAQHIPRAVCSCRLTKLKMRAENEEKFRKPRTIENRDDLDPLFLHLPSCLVAKIVHKALINSLDLMTSIPVTLLEYIPDIGLQMEAERYHLCDLLEGRFVLEEQGKINGRTKKDGGTTSDVVCTNISPRQPRSGVPTKLRLPSYFLDFGVVVMGTIASRVIRTINTGHEQITFRFEPTSLAKISRLGFSPNISQIRQLPGSPHCDFVDWEICFDPKAANLTPGYVSSELLIAVANGPIIPIWLQAEIVVPELKSHLTTVEFGEVQRGEARLVTVQLENPSPIPVHWYKRTNRGPHKDKSSVRGFGQVNLRANRKGIQSKQPPIFDVIPLSGIVRPKEKCNIQVKFTPLDHRRYEEQVVLVVENAPEDLHIRCRGYGLEPRLEFDQTMLQFDPCLPYGPGDERTVIVSNPCNYPIEFYSLEMDSIAFEQDQILRSLDGYDQYGQLLLPPRKAGEGLPTEILTYWEEQLRRNLEAKEATNENTNQLISASGHNHEVVPVAHAITESLKKHRMTSTNFLATTLNSDRIHLDNCDNKIGSRTMHDITPVSLANAHYLGLDISEGTRGSLKHQGIGIIVHGPLASIRKGTVESLAECYHASILSVDQVIMDALATGSGEAATFARECCAEAGRAICREALRAREIEMKESKLPDTGEVPFESEPQKTSDVNDLQGETLNLPDGTEKKLRRAYDLISTASGPQHGNGDPANRVSTTATTTTTAITTTTTTATKLVPRRTSHMLHGNTEGRPTSPPILGAPVPRRISLTGFSSTGSSLVDFTPIEDRTELCGDEEPVELHEDQLYSVVLPEDLVVCLLKERFAQEDCFKGVIVNGLESQFTESHQKTAQLVLRAFEERQFIYAVTVRAELAYLKALEEEMEAKSSMAKEAENIARREWALQLDEFEYSLLTEDEQRMVDELRTKQRREIRRRELEAKRRREDQEREEREAEARRLDLERMNKRKGKKMEEKVVKPPLQLPAGEAKDTRGTPGRPASRATLEKDRSLKGTLGGDFGDVNHLTAVDRRRASKSSDRKRRSVASMRDETLAEETEESVISAEDKALCQWFKTFNVEFPGICDLFSTWDRIAQAQRLTTGLDESNELAFFSPNLLQPPNARKNKQVSAVKPKKSVARSDTSRTDGTHGDTISDALNPLPPIYCDNLPSDNGVGSVLSELTTSKPTLSERTSYMSKPTSRGLIGLGVPHLIADAQLNATPHVVQDIKQEVSQALASISVLRPFAMQDEADVLQSHQWTDHDAENKGSPVFSVLTAHLPNPEDILEHLGIGSKGPPIPAPVNFSVIQYPPARTAPMQVHSCAGNGRSSGNKSPPDRGEAERNKSYRSTNTPNEESNPALKNLQYFQFLYSGQGDPKMGDGHTTDSMSTLIDDRNSEAPGDLHSSKSALRTTRRERKTPRGDLIDHGRKTSVVSRGHSVQASVPVLGLPSSIARGSMSGIMPDPGIIYEESQTVDSSLSTGPQTLQCYRWLVPSKDQIRLRIRFRSDRVGQFDQLLNFEIVGTRRLYQIYCRGICALPTISREPRLIFSNRKRGVQPGEIVHNAYVLDSGIFEFGPLLIEKTKERVLEGYFPENQTSLTLVNNSPLSADIRLGFMVDANEDTFGVSPRQLLLKPGESGSVTMWAFPRTAKRFEDSLVCSIKDNPKPTIFKVACDGTLPELILDKKTFNFERVLLQRKEVRSITLRNPTLLPVQWKLAGVDALGEEFSVPQDAGIVEPKSEFVVYAYFRAMKPFKSAQKKSLRLEVYDMDNLAGLIQADTIQVIAEAYDVALDISFPKGSDGGIDFGLCRIGDETKHSITLKNKGPYEITVNLVFQKSSQRIADPGSVFTVTPSRINLGPSEKAAVIVLSFCSKAEYVLEDEPVLRCQVIEPNAKGNAELIASIPIKLSIRALFSKFTISPSKQMDFGAIIVQHRKSRQLLIENNGEHDFRFSILRMSKMKELVSARDSGLIRVRASEMALLSSPQTKLQLGFFTITPASGTVSPNNTQLITVECSIETRTRSEEELAIEITDRDSNMYRYGIPYTLIAEGHIPSIVTKDHTVIFEEHRICQNLQLVQQEESSDEVHSGGVYGVEENCFLFTNALVGARVRARFCIANRGQVPAEVSFEIVGQSTSTQAPTTGRSSSRSTSGVEAFELDPEKAQIDPHSVTYVNVTFTPSAMQNYKASFKAYLDNLPTSGTISGTGSSGRGSGTPGGSKRSQTGAVLSFELAGQGHLPSVAVLRPQSRNRQGEILCVFKRLQLRTETSRVLALKNNGVLSSRVNLTLIDADHVFFLEPVEVNSTLLFLNPQVLPDSKSSFAVTESPMFSDSTPTVLDVESQFSTAGLLLRPNAEFAFNVYFRPKQSGVKSLGQIKMVVVNNPYEDTSVELIGESLADEVCLQDLPQLEPERALCIKEAIRYTQQSTKASGDATRLDELDAELNRDEAQLASAMKHNELDFGDCSPNDTLCRTFTLVHSSEPDSTSFKFSWPTNHPTLQFKPAEGHLHPGRSKRITVVFKPGGVPVTLQSTCVKCVLHRIRVPISEGCEQPMDWDDTKQIIQWVDAPIDISKNRQVNNPDVTHHSNADSRTESQRTASRAGSSDQDLSEFGSVYEVIRRKQKLIEVEPEPTFEEYPDRTDPKPIDLLVSATADFAQYICDVENIRFRDTMMFQRRIYRFELMNCGLVTLNYRWTVNMLSGVSKKSAQELEKIDTNDWESDLVPFTVSPSAGEIFPGKSTFIQVTFYPLLAGEFEAQLVSHFDNLASPTENSGRMTMKRNRIIPLAGVAQQSYVFLDLVESDYLISGRRNPELPGPLGAPPGTTLDPCTRVIEFHTIGVGVKNYKNFFIANLTTDELRFSIINEDITDTKEIQPVTCKTPRGVIASGKKTEVTFEFTAITIGLIESFWRLSVDDLQVTVPLLVVCNTREPLILFERSCVRLHPVLVGHTVHETLCLINQECNDAELLGELARGVPFCFVESSCYGVGRQDCVKVEPMAGVIEPSSRCPIKISFTAKAERLLNVNLICRVQYRQLPLTLNIKAEGFTISTSAWLQNIGEGVSNLELTPLWSPCSGITDPGDYAEDAARHLIDHPKYQSKLHPLDFGTVQPGECVSRKITIMNSGKFKCDFSLRMISLCKSSVRSTRLFNLLVGGVNEKNFEPVLHLDRTKGSLSPGEKTQCSVMFSPPKNSTVFPGSNIRLTEHSIACLVAIREGPAYGLSLAGCTSGQTVHFSPGVIDFGPQILTIKGISSAKRYLTLRNTDAKRPVSVECLTPDCAVFKQSLEPTILQSRSSGSDDGSGLDTYRVEITFTPQVCQQYEKELVFEMNGSMQQSILVRGEGADLVVDNKPGPLTIIRVNQPISQDRVQQILPVPDTCVKNRPIHMGTLQPNQRSRRFVTLINRSSAQIRIHRVSLNQTGNGSVGVSRMASSLTDTKTTTSALAGTLSAVTLRLCQPISEDHQTSMAPISEVKAPVILKPKNGQIMVEISFTPSKRLPSFTREVLCEISAYDPESLTNGSKTSDSDREPKFYLPVFSVQGACRTYDIQLDKSSVSFGPVVQGSQLTKSLTLLNHGDLGSKFRWLADTFAHGLSISPTEGFIEAGTEVPFTVTLSPTELDPDIRMENVTCQLQGCEPLKLIITAMCTPPAVMKDVALFSTMVRQKDTRTLQIANRTNAVWELRPVIDSEHWTGAQVFTIQPQETNSYEVTYHPLTMTTEGRKHKGTLFFPLPDGNGLLYNLSGTSDPPKPLVKISREVECKLTHTEVISIPNWLCQAQRFRVTREIVRTEKADPNTSLKGLDYIDVPADGSRDYKLSFLSYREGTVYARVTFTNDQTGEYQFCEITFKIMRPKSLGTIQMRSPARKSVVKSVRLENPLNVPVSLSLSTTPSEVQCPNQLQVPPNCEASVTLEFCPLRAGSFTGRLDASCSELGVLSYDLELEATPAGPEPVTYFEASIGQRHTRTVRFCNGAKVKTEFLTKLDNSDFQCDRQVNAAPGVEVNLEVTFEPTVVGTRFSQLIVTSLHAGDYVFPLQGLAIEPRPQGPIVIRAGETTHITIRNVFQSAMLYSFQVDNTAFNLPKQNEVIRARKEYRIAVGLDASSVSSGIRAPVTGKLIVTCIQAETTTRAPAAKRTGSNEPDPVGLSVARSRKPGLTEGMQWVYYLRGVSS